MKSLLIFLALSASASEPAATDARDRGDRVFKSLHQAVGYLEAYAKGACPSGATRAKAFLGEARDETAKGIDVELMKLLNEMELAREGIDKTQVASIEKMREKLHTLGTIRNYEHQPAWHMEIQSCL